MQSQPSLGISPGCAHREAPRFNIPPPLRQLAGLSLPSNAMCACSRADLEHQSPQATDSARCACQAHELLGIQVSNMCTTKEEDPDAMLKVCSQSWNGAPLEWIFMRLKTHLQENLPQNPNFDEGSILSVPPAWVI